MLAHEGVLVRRARARQLFGLLLIPSPAFGVDSTPRMGEWGGGMRRFGMISPHGLAPFRLGIWTGPFPSPIVPSLPSLMCFRGSVSAPGANRASFFIIPHPCLFLPPPHQIIWSTFSPCLRIWPILCTQLMTMARVVVGSGGSDILCC